MDTESKPLRRHPARVMVGQSMQTTLAMMIIQREHSNAALDKQGYNGRRVMGYKLPSWQRQAKWSDEQCSRFLESIWMGVGLGTFMVNSNTFNETIDQILLDGQQRLRAIERYFDGEVSVLGQDGNAYPWTELNDGEQAHFLRISFPWIESQYKVEQDCVDAYNRHNFGGTQHEESERAQLLGQGLENEMSNQPHEPNGARETHAGSVNLMSQGKL
ncbi:MAG: DUF262 domain-containing protein [Dehalococcoidia bacterium]|uniref:DUF262 domain-containing protein n=1 Tax=unclassified Pseudomonas TaxID=196821 RepID=UPI0014734581|nr:MULTISPECIES: DUF262 domain-containing protein [unclassified Pseudomonas]NMX92595.1 DUF262 domain-containing protein [Pseudomonas sp. WS 5086]NMY47126.1 DUF262 domain-containing protein [Pseudomonas sp. WS 5027]